MNFIGLFFLLIAHYFCGKSLIRLFRINIDPLTTFCLSMITGVALISFVPCIMQLLQIPFSVSSVCISVALFTVVMSVPLFIQMKKPQFHKFSAPPVYEWPFLITVALLVLISVWKCYFFPPTPRDLITGPELLAEYAVREHTMISSVFSIDLSTTNNIFKSPYITGLQILYKILVAPFGQVWLSVISVPFIVWLYSICRRSLHPLIAGFLMIFFISVPELYAYSYLVLYDYSNMVFFFAGSYFLIQHLRNDSKNDLLLAAFMFGIATYVRVETIVLVGLIIPLLLFHLRRSSESFGKKMMRAGLFMAVPFLFYFVCVHVFIANFIPIPFNTGNQLNQNLSDFSVFFNKFAEMNRDLIFSSFGIFCYGYLIYFFIAIFFADMYVVKGIKNEEKAILYLILVVYIGLPFIAYLSPLVDIHTTMKRGLFKIFPLILLYLCSSEMMIRFTNYLNNLEKSRIK